MERSEHSTAVWHAYVAGFFDGEGSVSIARQRVDGRAHFHKIIVTLTQDSKHRRILDDVCTEFGGHVILREAVTRVTGVWCESARWQLQKRSNIEAFLLAIQPYSIVKSAQIALALEFLALTRNRMASISRDPATGRILGHTLDKVDLAKRETMRLRMLDLNKHNARRGLPSHLPPLPADELPAEML